MGTLSRSNWNLEKYCSFLREGKTGVSGGKTLSARTRTNNKLNPHVIPSLGIKPGAHWYYTIPALQNNYWNITDLLWSLVRGVKYLIT